jgi:hypothetical protein
MSAIIRPLLLATLLLALPAGEEPFIPGQVFAFSPDVPKYIDTSLEFHDASGVKWPMFLYGRPVSGGFTADAREPQALFTVVCDHLAQPGGTHERNILGELVGERPLAVTVSVLSLAPLTTGEREVRGRDGRSERRKTAFFPVKAELGLAGRRLPMNGEATVRYEGRPATMADLTLRFLITGADLGLKASGCGGAIALTVYAGAAAAGTGGGKK